MQKKLIALAVAGMFAVPAAFAATSNVDIYGVLNVDVNRVDQDVNGVDNQVSVSSNASRIGFKGSEDLGGGLSAIWQIESGFTADEGTGNFATRNTFVGLKGGFGTILAGRHDTPVKLLGRSVDNFGDGMADSRNLLGSERFVGANVFDLRPNNTIAYTTPDMSGLTAMLAYVTGTGTDNGLDNNDTDLWSANVVYANGPFMLGAGYEKHNTATNDEKIWRLVGKFTMADLTLGAQYDNASSDIDSDNDHNGWGVFANYKLGAVTLKANYLSVGDAKGVNDSGAKQYTLGADYALSKRSTVYAYYAQIKNDRWAAYTLGQAAGVSDSATAVTGTWDADPSVFGIGMKHSF